MVAPVSWMEDERKLARILLEVEAIDTKPANGNGDGRQAPGSTPAGAVLRLRGIPAIGRGVTGAVRGSVPHVDGLG